MLEDYITTVETAAARHDRLTAQIAAMLPDWTLAPVVAALQTMRGMALVNAATLIAALATRRLCPSLPTDGRSRAGALRAFERRQRQARRHHQNRQQRSAPAVDRGGVVLPLSGPDQPRRQEDQSKPICDIAWKGKCGCARVIAASPEPASPPMLLLRRSPRELAGFVWAIARWSQNRQG